jgi:hypothetical protein
MTGGMARCSTVALTLLLVAMGEVVNGYEEVVTRSVCACVHIFRNVDALTTACSHGVSPRWLIPTGYRHTSRALWQES